ncbi:MAG: hypothetical protein LPK45_11525, partial [Bacteroidota bacterium]|nr:hypothetical protein [Bacteroidota bacterium]MDX5431736.1 hypothetical protein [Bacteroidota bacterium]MDX5470451.1 hypothetical protein [Bacteroidota bacterium]
MSRLFNRFLLVSALLMGALTNSIQATHIVGGDLTYDYLGSNRYRFNLYVYVDCFFGRAEAIAQDAFSQIGVFDSNGNLRQSLSLTRQGPTRVEGKNYSCVVPPADQCVDLYIFTTETTLSDIAGGYDLMWQRCCRNHSIKNIDRPEDVGITFRTHIPQRSVIAANSSPKFKGVPPNFLCTNEPLKYDHSA